MTLAELALPTLPVLVAATPREWVDCALAGLPALLADHAHCEHKAAASALSLIAKYPDEAHLVTSMMHLAQEELGHFERIVTVLRARGWPLGTMGSDGYVRDLLRLGRREEPHHRVDRLLLLGLVEARSAERFTLLASSVDDPELAVLYRELAFPEAGHHHLFVSLACHVQPREHVLERLSELATLEAEVMLRTPLAPRMH